MSKSVVVVGGGLIGVATALILSDRGAEVTIIDREVLGSGASKGNAGFMCTTLLEPLAAPGAVKSALTSLNDPTRALRVHTRALPSMIGWGMHFARSATQKRYVAGRVALAKLNLRHDEAMALLGGLGVDVTLGPELVVPFKDPAVGEHYLSTLRPMADYGVKLPDGLLDGDEMRRIVPALSDEIRAGYVVSGDHSIDPRVFVDSMITALRARGATVLEHTTVQSVGHAHGHVNSITVRSRDGGSTTLVPDEVILAAGAGSRPVGKLFDLRIAVIPGQGYNVGLPVSAGLTHPVIFEEAHAVATPFSDRIRLGGTMEFDGLEPRFDQRRVDAILTSMRRFVNLDFDAHFGTWSGSRPMSPDGLPLMGRPRQFDNLVLAAGHGMFGLSLTPTSALAIAELVLEGRSSIDLADFDPDRFSVRKLVSA